MNDRNLDTDLDLNFKLNPLVSFFENLQPQHIADFPHYYAEGAQFKDPFNEVQGLAAIQRIFAHLFEQVAEPRFEVHERIVDSNGAVLVWTMVYRARGSGTKPTAQQSIRGVSHLKFDSAGKVISHRDYWDAAEELYAKLPVLGWLMRLLQKQLKS